MREWSVKYSNSWYAFSVEHSKYSKHKEKHYEPFVHFKLLLHR